MFDIRLQSARAHRKHKRTMLVSDSLAPPPRHIKDKDKKSDPTDNHHHPSHENVHVVLETKVKELKIGLDETKKTLQILKDHVNMNQSSTQMSSRSREIEEKGKEKEFEMELKIRGLEERQKNDHVRIEGLEQADKKTREHARGLREQTQQNHVALQTLQVEYMSHLLCVCFYEFLFSFCCLYVCYIYIYICSGRGA